MTVCDSRLTTHDSPKGRVLIIAGSDSGGGAGIQGDIKTVSALGGYAMTAITALTAQNTLGVFGIHPVPEDFIAQQIQLCLEDIGADAIKTGMLHSAGVIETVAWHWGQFKIKLSPTPTEQMPQFPWGQFDLKLSPMPPTPATPLVVDPVMVAKGGSPLLEASALHALKTRLIPHATVITPNLPEAELLLGRTIDEAKMEDAARALLDLGCGAVLLKGGHGSGETLTDVLVVARAGETMKLATPRIATRNTHGTGCAFASGIATGLAQKLPLADAVRRAHGYVQQAIRSAPGFGSGSGPLGH